MFKLMGKEIKAILGAQTVFIWTLDWFQSLKQFYINVSYHMCSQSNSGGSVFKTEPSELDWLQVYDMTH